MSIIRAQPILATNIHIFIVYEYEYIVVQGTILRTVDQKK